MVLRTPQTPLRVGAEGSLPSSQPLAMVAAGEHVYHEGEPTTGIYEIVEGVVILYRTDTEGTRQLLGMRLVGNILAVSGSKEHTCSAVATRPTRLRRLCSPEMEARIAHHPRLASLVLEALRLELRYTREQLLVVGARSAIGRVAALLLEIADRTGGGVPVFTIPLTRREMADYVGLTLETVSRTMTRLTALQVITLQRTDEVIILNRAKLIALANGESEGAARGRIGR